MSGNNNEAYQIISELAAFYRQSLSKGSDVVTLREEVEITKSYLSIQNIRYPEIFTSEIEVPEEAEYVRIPKLTLQPLVENALYHGIRPLGSVVRFASLPEFRESTEVNRGRRWCGHE